MEAIGEIANAYLSGALDDDAAVALMQGPEEVGSPPLTEPLVDVEATLAQLGALGLLTAAQQADRRQRARALYYQDRTVEALFADLADPAERARLEAAYETHRQSPKTRDALAVVARLRALPDRLGPLPGWTLSTPDAWRSALAEFSGTRRAA
jgi:hypothetical protein